MKEKLLPVLAVLIVMLALCGCRKSGPLAPLEDENFDYDASYALGMDMGANFVYNGVVPNLEGFLQGVRDQLSGGETKFNEEEAMMKIEEAFSAVMEKREADYLAMMEEMGAEARQEEIAFLAENSKKPGITITASGLQYEVISQGNGPKPTAENMVRVHYEGWLIDGTLFDSSTDWEGNPSPVEFPLNRVIPGWIEGLQLMGVGSKYRFYIPSELAYGPGGSRSIPPYSALIFEVELLEILN